MDRVASALALMARFSIQGSKKVKTVEGELPSVVKMEKLQIVRKKMGSGVAKRWFVGTSTGLGVEIVNVQMGKPTKWEMTEMNVRVCNAMGV